MHSETSMFLFEHAVLMIKNEILSDTWETIWAQAD